MDNTRASTSEEKSKLEKQLQREKEAIIWGH